MWSGAGGEMKERTNQQKRLQDEVRSRLGEPDDRRRRSVYLFKKELFGWLQKS